MRLGSARIGGILTPVVSQGDAWYNLHTLRPETRGFDLLSLIGHEEATSLLSDISRETLDLPPNAEPARIPTPERFALPYLPRQIVCVGRNYAAHAHELGNEIPSSPVLFNKLPSSCIGDGDYVDVRAEYGRVDYEGEIAVVIGRNCSEVSQEDAFDAILGYTLLNDFTARDVQQKAKEKGHPWLMAKSLRTFCPVGPYITGRDDVAWPLELDLSISVNGAERQRGNIRQLIFDVPMLISYISRHFPLVPGDIIATGTPSGVAPVNDGDRIELTATGLGTLKNEVRFLSDY